MTGAAEAASRKEGAERDAYLALALVPGIGPGRLHALLAACQTASGALRAPLDLLRGIPGMSNAAARAVHQATPDDGRRVRRAVDREGGVVLLPGDAAFPSALLTIPDPPAALFARGRLELVAPVAVAIVGSRDHTSYGAEVCTAVSAGAVDAGLTVVSGMARGLDAIAHRTALAAGGGTIGVLGNGLGVVYPAANRELYRAMSRRGLLLTEFPPGERPFAGCFQRRNRLIAGLAAATVVVEAGAGSGALITAAHALEQGREVLAVPGPVTRETSKGVNRLIRDGARPLLELEDLLAVCPGPRARRAPRDGGAAEAEGPRPRLLALLRDGSRHVDQLAAAMACPPGALLGLLGALEIEGLVTQHPGLIFARSVPTW